MPRTLPITVALLLAALITSPSRAAAPLPIQDKAIDWKKGRSEIHLHYPQTGIDAIDKKMEQYALDSNQTDMHLGDLRMPHDYSSGRSNFSLTVTYEITRNDGEMFGVLFDGNQYNGGAHGIPFEASFQFSVPNGQQIELNELVDGRRGLSKVATLAREDLFRQFKGSEQKVIDAVHDDIINATKPDYIAYAPFRWGNDRLTLTFSAIGGYAGGDHTVVIPMANLADVIRPDPSKPQPSFSCQTATTKIERTICLDVDLAKSDWKLALRYRVALEQWKYSISLDHKYPAGDPIQQQRHISDMQSRIDKLIASQRAWLAQRNRSCASGDLTCLRDSYKARLKNSDL